MKKNVKEKLKKCKSNLKNNKGITLIALVITIIVLLILAGVSLSMVFNQDGIFKRAENAANKWNQASANEAKYLNDFEDTFDEYYSRYTGEERHNPGKSLVDMFKKAQTAGCTDGKNCTEPGEHVHIGDYVTNFNSTLKGSGSVVLQEYETGVTGTQTYNVDTSTTWRIAGLSEDKTQLIITTGSPLKKASASGFTDEQMTDNEGGKEAAMQDPYLYMFGGEAWYNTKDENSSNILDRICRLYDSKYATKTASMRIEDINALVGVKVDKTAKTITKNDTAVTGAQHFFGQTYTYKNGDYAPENYLKEKYKNDGKYQNLTTRNIGDTVDGSAYMYPLESVVESTSKLYDVLFKGTTASENYAKSYWLASPGVAVGSDGCSFGPGAVDGGDANAGIDAFNSYGDGLVAWLGVRPVVYLQSGITTGDLTITGTGSESDTGWTGVAGSVNGKDLGYGQMVSK